jgi:hypothetical protein
MIDTFLCKTDFLEVAFFLNFSRLLRDVGLLNNDGRITIFSLKNATSTQTRKYSGHHHFIS